MVKLETTNFSKLYAFSFIVIGKNEGWKLTKCLDSIVSCVDKNNIISYEILYIDSRSTDDSIKKAKKISNVKLFSITGKCNAAIARNIGGKEATGDILIFLDGDMELQSDFISNIFNDNGDMIHPFISGMYCHWLYDSGWNLINKKVTPQITDNYVRSNTGGFFVITKAFWNEIGGMDTRLTVNEDFDFGLKATEKRVFVLLIAQVGINHHTIPYQNRIWGFITKSRYSALLMRKHFFNKNYWKMSWRMNYTVMILFISLVSMTFFQYSYIFYLLVLFLRSMSKGIKHLPKRFVFLIIRDIVFLTALFCYYPTKVEISYKRL